ncbi:iron ABC transporter [Rufibacter radiotolerans]|uniref:Iron ABC transporter n=2 Tax=Rufibacter radiotolerans TaxID=1379910 RepID=A0A0H4VQH7_9BACT|nr:iron ABC transporter [Rufibacter radiotolerans]
MNRQVELLQPPQRIISLVPSQTELLFDLGLGEKVVGITKFCVHPKAQVKGIAKVGGTKDFKPEVIEQLKPDLIIGNKEENDQVLIEALEQRYPVWMSDIYTLQDALRMISGIGQVTGAAEKAEALVQDLQQKFAALVPAFPPIPAAYFIWRKPYMAVGGHNFIDDMLQCCGFDNVFKQIPRYPELTIDAIQAANPRLILLSSEPYPFQEKHLAEFQAMCPEAQIKIVDGEMFSWYGSRLALTVPYLHQLVKEVSQL